jgi:hypothetical protein
LLLALQLSVTLTNTLITNDQSYLKYDKQDQQETAAFNERNPHTTQQENQWQGIQTDPKQKLDRAQSRTG